MICCKRLLSPARSSGTWELGLPSQSYFVYGLVLWKDARELQTVWFSISSRTPAIEFAVRARG